MQLSTFGGVSGIVLLLISILSVGIISERSLFWFSTLRKDRRLSSNLIDNFLDSELLINVIQPRDYHHILYLMAKRLDQASLCSIDKLQDNISLPEYDPQKDATFQIEVYKNMLGIKMDKYILFFELADNKETVEKIKRFREIIVQEVDNKQIRVTITQNTDGKSYVMKITGNNVKPVDSINLSSLEKIHVYQSSFIKLRTPEQQKKRRDRIKGKKDEPKQLQHQNISLH
mgnify:CR=1 FL=1